jgi:hypothetical protein
MDDLPLWPRSYPPSPYTVAGIVRAIEEALDEHGIRGVYAFCNSWPLEPNPEFTTVLDGWVAAGHHVANHTHSHIPLPEMSAETFIDDVALAEERLAHWLSRAPLKLFRHPHCEWGETPEKLAAVNTFLASRGLTTVDVTSWAYEWTFNRAYRNALDSDDVRSRSFIIESFLDFAAAQLRHDMEWAERWFGGPIVGIALAHTVPFFADVAPRYFARLRAEGVEFVSLEEALDGPAQRAVGTVVSHEFLVLQQKLAHAAGVPQPQLPDASRELFATITGMARGQTG